MEFLNFFNWANSEYIEELYSRFQKDPNSVDEKWRVFFGGFELGLGRPVVGGPGGTGEFATLSQRRSDGTGNLVHSYRGMGHTMATLDPLGSERPVSALLNLNEFGFSDADFDRTVGNGGFLGQTDGTLRDLIGKLRQTYCGNIGVEYMDIKDKQQRDWLQERLELAYNQPQLNADDKKRILKLLVEADEFEQFLNTKFIGQKRFSCEGGEAVIPLLDRLVEVSADLGAQALVLGMAHRGRLNTLAHILRKPYEYTLSEFEGMLPDEATAEGDGDVKYHKGYSNDMETRSGKVVHLSLSPNPSHLEVVDPVVVGSVRAKQERLGDQGQDKVIPILIHGEAAFAGQGIVTETLNLSELKGYRTGGTIHVIINNQLGFTATATETRFTPYPTDVAKAIEAPIFHVNADDPESVVHVAQLAAEFRQRFKVDVMLDLWCYRRYGHNETDDPTFTQPMMYEKIKVQVPVAQTYAQRLVSEGVLTEGEVGAMKKEVHDRLEAALSIARKDHPREKTYTFSGLWKGLTRSSEDASAKTAITDETIERISANIMRIPEGFNVHKKLVKLLEMRQEMADNKRQADWACAEMWAMGSLLLEGTPVRLTGQDCERGTFSHRHAVLHDSVTGEIHIPLAKMEEGQAKFTIVNTMLSELAVVGFEFGYSSADPRSLVMWEAQFGDFFNMAQPIFDHFICSSESKWQRMSGLVLLLPHGYEGQGPEHSSARLERFLQLCADNNIQVCYPSVPSQYFHLLRRQILRPFRKPLVLMMPKSMLRDARSSSPKAAFTSGTFETVLDDDAISAPQSVERIVFCTGKVFFAVQAKRDEEALKQIALVRVEQLYPFPEQELKKVIAKYAGAREFVWLQEEPRNMGAWSFIGQRLSALLPEGSKLSYRGRKEASSPATGIYRWHLKEEEEFVRQALSPVG